MSDFRRWFLGAAMLVVCTSPAPAQYLITTLAGGLPESTAAPATAYSIRNASGVATDQFGNTYFTTTSNCAFRLDVNGNLSRVAGNCRGGFSGDGGSATKAQLNNPQGIAVDVLGNLYIADENNQRVRKVTPSGIITTVAGTGVAGYSADNVPAVTSQLNRPQGVAVDPDGNLYIADQANQRIRKVAPNGTITTMAGNGTVGSTGDGGAATSATLNFPIAVALDAARNLYIGDASNQVRKVSPGGTITHFAGTGVSGFSGDSGPAATAKLANPSGLAADASGNLFITDQYNLRIRKINPNGIITTVVGNGNVGSTGDGGPATNATLGGPTGVAVDYNNNLFISDSSNRVRKVSANGTISTAAGTGSIPSAGDGGPAVFVQFTGNWGMVRDSSGNIYVADWKNSRVRKITPAGVISTFAGTGICCSTGDGGPATSASVSANILAIDGQGNIYLAESGKIRKVSGGIINTVVGLGGNGFGGDNGPAIDATLSAYLPGMVFDSNGNLYIADYSNNRVRKVDTNGIITTFAGNGFPIFGGDGGAATSASLSRPTGLAVDSNNNLFIADYGNYRVRKVSGGIITTVAGIGTSGSGGDGGPATSAQIFSPWGLAFDGNGSLFITTEGNTVRKVSGGTITTVAGTGFPAYSGDGGPALTSELNYPLTIISDPSNNLYFSDYVNNSIRVLEPVGTKPLLTMSSTPGGVFTTGQAGASYTVTVSNSAQAAATSGVVTVTDLLPPSLTLVSMSGNGWSCNSTVCTRGDSLAAGDSYPVITVAVNVGAGSAPQVTNRLTVTGGGALPAGTVVSNFVGSPSPVLSISLTHAGNFATNQNGTYYISVANQPSAASTTGTVTVTDTLPSGLSLVSMTGNGWTCNGNSCNRSDALVGGASYDPITVVAGVAANASSPLVNHAAVSGGGSPGATDDDSTIIGSFTCDVNGDGSSNVSDVQTIINEALGVTTPVHDLNGDGSVNISDIQIVINAALGLGCAV